MKKSKNAIKLKYLSEASWFWQPNQWWPLQGQQSDLPGTNSSSLLFHHTLDQTLLQDRSLNSGDLTSGLDFDGHNWLITKKDHGAMTNFNGRQ